MKKQFAKTHNNLFKRAVALMRESGELDKKWAHRRKVKRVRKAIECLATSVRGDIEEVSTLPLLIAIDDAEVLQDVICHMIYLEGRDGE